MGLRSALLTFDSLAARADSRARPGRRPASAFSHRPPGLCGAARKGSGGRRESPLRHLAPRTGRG
jgi:hypothetical protein